MTLNAVVMKRAGIQEYGFSVYGLMVVIDSIQHLILCMNTIMVVFS